MPDSINDRKSALISLCNAAKQAGAVLSCSTGQKRNDAIRAFIKYLNEHTQSIIQANRLDLENGVKNNMKSGMLDRLTLSSERINAVCASLEKVIALPDPLGNGAVWERPNGLVIRKVSVPIGVIGIIYEARPNVTVDAAALCIKSGNTVILRGGSDAINTNKAVVSVLRQALASVGLSEDCIGLVTDTDRETASVLMRLNGYIDLLIPRGSAGLIRSVVENATVPFIETGAGNCHIYVHSDADIEKAVRITINAKTQRPSVCNAAETLLVHKSIASEFLPLIAEKMSCVELRGCEKTAGIIKVIPAEESDWSTEYNDMIIAVKVVDSLEEAVQHINRYTTHHSEAIITEAIAPAEYFRRSIDAAVVYVNASTRFTDGEEFGFGAEVGISTQKLHARGPMGLTELTTVKYYVDGNGQIR